VRAFNLVHGDLIGLFDTAREAAPDFAMAYLGKAMVFAVANDPDLMTKAKALVKAARPFRLNESERARLAALPFGPRLPGRRRRHLDQRAGSRRARRCGGGPPVSHHLADRDLRGGRGDLQETACERRGGEFLELAGVRTAPITDKEAHTALATFSRYGKGRGHPAQLNLGDCFADAMAKNAQATLLFKGEGIDKTDILPVVR